MPFQRPFIDVFVIRSEVAGRMSVQEGAKYLERPMEGRGKLLSGTDDIGSMLSDDGF